MCELLVTAIDVLAGPPLLGLKHLLARVPVLQYLHGRGMVTLRVGQLIVQDAFCYHFLVLHPQLPLLLRGVCITLLNDVLHLENYVFKSVDCSLAQKACTCRQLLYRRRQRRSSSRGLWCNLWRSALLQCGHMLHMYGRRRTVGPLLLEIVDGGSGPRCRLAGRRPGRCPGRCPYCCHLCSGLCYCHCCCFSCHRFCCRRVCSCCRRIGCRSPFLSRYCRSFSCPSGADRCFFPCLRCGCSFLCCGRRFRFGGSLCNGLLRSRHRRTSLCLCLLNGCHGHLDPPCQHCLYPLCVRLLQCTLGSLFDDERCRLRSSRRLHHGCVRGVQRAGYSRDEPMLTTTLLLHYVLL